jgi:hypothetical protein
MAKQRFGTFHLVLEIWYHELDPRIADPVRNLGFFEHNLACTTPDFTTVQGTS